MKTENIALSVAIAALILLASIAYRLWSPTAWEYAIVSPADYELGRKLSAMGQKGWDVASARRALNDKTGVYEIIFKRPAGRWNDVSGEQASGETNGIGSSDTYSHAKEVVSVPASKPISYPAPDTPRAQLIMRACLNGKAVALKDGKWVPLVIGGMAMTCVVDP